MAAAIDLSRKMEPGIEEGYDAIYGDMPEVVIGADRPEIINDAGYARDISQAIDNLSSPKGKYSPVGAEFSRGRLDILVKVHCAEKISIGHDKQEYDPLDTFEPLTEVDEKGNERDLGGQSRVYLGYGQVPDPDTRHGYRLMEYIAIAGYAGDPDTFMDVGEIQAKIDIKTRCLDRKIVPEVYDVDYIPVENDRIIPVTIMETVHGKELIEYMDCERLPLSQRLEIFKRYV